MNVTDSLLALLAEEMVKYACEPFVAQEKRQENEDQEDQPS